MTSWSHSRPTGLSVQARSMWGGRGGGGRVQSRCQGWEEGVPRRCHTGARGGGGGIQERSYGGRVGCNRVGQDRIGYSA